MENRPTVTEHLEELRVRIIRSLVVLGMAMLASIPFSSRILSIIMAPASGVIDKLVFFSPEEGFLIYMKASFISGLIIALPLITYEIWAFISPAVEGNLKKHALRFVVYSTVAFISGSAFCYFILLPAALKFLLGLGGRELQPLISADRYISFVTRLIIACGIVFEMPLLSFFLARLGIVNERFLRKNFKYALVLIFIVAAIITPTGDAFNMLVLALPMVVLYEASIWVAFLAKRRQDAHGR
jgi:sec-independent protein translocase protein TatC